MHADRFELHTILQLRLKQYKLEHGKEMEISAIAQLLMNTLYGRRFFPYYTFNLLCGVNSDGQGVVYGYDAIGSYKEDGYGAVGSSMEMVSPMLDLTVHRMHDTNYKKQKPALTLDECTNTVKAVLNACAERDIECGDGLKLIVITPDGVKQEILPLRQD